MNNKLIVHGTEIAVTTIDDKDYISLTDMLKAKDGDFFISDWLRNRNTVERGSTFGTDFLDCPKSRPSFCSQSLAIQGFCSDKLSVRIWTLKSKQLKMAAEAVENRRSEPLFPETGLLLRPKKCVLILLWRLKVQSGMRAFLIIESNLLVNLLSQFSL